MLHERGPRLVIEPQARVEPVAEAIGVFEGERDEGGGGVARDTGEDDADELGARRLVGRAEGEDGTLGQGVQVGHGSLPVDGVSAPRQ